MVSKGVVSRLARLFSVGVAAVASTIGGVAMAAPTPAHGATGTGHATSSRAHAHVQATTASSGGAVSSKSASKVSTRKASVRADRAEKASDKADKDPPKQSLTPLPTIAASMAAPLALTVTTSATGETKVHASSEVHVDSHAEPRATAHAMRTHGAEPRRTPMVLASHVVKKAAPVKPPCLRDATIIMRGAEEEKIALTRCDGSAAPLAVEQISVMVRPGSAAKPALAVQALAKSKTTELAPGIRRVDPRLVERLQSMVDHFARAGAANKVFVVSGYRPMSAGSFHATGRALDFRIDGVKNEELVAYCKTLEDTGCGYYPNSSFVHVDVRDGGTGHVSWIDASGPGQSPKYVAAWPPPKDESEDNDADPAHLLAKLETELQLLPPPNEHTAKTEPTVKAEMPAKVEVAVKSEPAPKTDGAASKKPAPKVEEPAAATVKELNVEITP
jgi:hypothetical protein